MGTAERTPRRNESDLRLLAAEQFGAFSREQAIAAGVTASSITRRVSSGAWERVMPGVYVVVGAPDSDRRRAMAAALWAGPGSVVSHGTAGRLWGIPGARAARTELWVPLPRDPKHAEVVVHRGSRIDRADRTKSGPIPITTPERTLIDLAARMEDDPLAAAMESIFRQGLGRPERLAARLGTLVASGRPGAARLQELLAARGNGRALESALEVRIWCWLQRSGLSLPVRQHWVTTSGGRYRLDFAWPERKLALECDGWELHGDRRAFGKDRERVSDLAASGWRLLVVTWEMCTQGAGRLRQRVELALAA